LTADSDIHVRLVEPTESALLTGLIRRCYGESYIDVSFYDDDAVRERLRSGLLRSIGAFTDAGQLIGHMGITLRAHGGITADAGMTLVDPAFRGRGIARRVAGGLAKQSIAMGLVGVHDYPVTVHAGTQRIGKGFTVDTGVMLANMPADVVFERMEAPSAGERTSSVIRWIPLGPSPERVVYLPPRYREQIQSLYSTSYLSRTIAEPSNELTSDETLLHAAYDERRQALKIDVAGAGFDFPTAIDAEIQDRVREGALVAHVDLRLSREDTPPAAAALRGLGFFFSGLLPEYHDGDVLRMQWLHGSVNIGAADVIALGSTRAIEAFVLEDRQ